MDQGLFSFSYETDANLWYLDFYGKFIFLIISGIPLDLSPLLSGSQEIRDRLRDVHYSNTRQIWPPAAAKKIQFENTKMVISKGKSLDFGSKFAIFFRRRRPKIELYGIGVQKTIGFVPPT